MSTSPIGTRIDLKSGNIVGSVSRRQVTWLSLLATLTSQRMTETPGPYEVSRKASACIFCQADPARIVWSSSLVIAIRDGFPVSPGHALVVPRRHVSAWCDLTADEKSDVLAGIDAVRERIASEFAPDGYNVGFNDGAAAGQTVMHFHMHVIPRYVGDVPDPRGGVRWVLPGKAAYWQATER
jgi:diadenosine tetraphosphate (Ap4A) HIT family hydrolase